MQEPASKGSDQGGTDKRLDAGLFHPDAERSYTLPSTWYYDRGIYRREQAAIFYRNWIFQCHVTDVAEPGDRYRGSVADRAVLVARRQDGELVAYGASRGCDSPVRHGEMLAPAQAEPVRLENYGGFLFVNLDPDAVPLAQQSPKFLRDMYSCCPRLDELRHARRFERVIAANWKTVIDNNHECYHCALNHPSLMRLVDYANRAAWSNDAITFSHRVEATRANDAAYAVDPASCEQESLFGYVWPSLVPLFFPGTPGLVMFQVLPVGPEQTLIRHDFFFTGRGHTLQEREFMHWFSNVLSVEDVGLCENVQRGLRSRGYHQGRFVVDREHVEHSEHHVHFFQHLVLRALTAAGPY